MTEKTAKKMLKEQKRARRAERREAEMPYGLEHRRMENMPPQPPIGIKPSPLGVPTPYVVDGSDGGDD